MSYPDGARNVRWVGSFMGLSHLDEEMTTVAAMVGVLRRCLVECLIFLTQALKVLQGYCFNSTFWPDHSC